MEGDLSMGGEPATQYTDDVLWSCTLETCIIFLKPASSDVFTGDLWIRMDRETLIHFKAFISVS